MNLVEASRFRRALIIILSIAFTGGLLVFTAQANLDLLQKVYINPQYVAFGMLALEGGVVYWTGYYLLHWNGTHKAVAVTMAVLDFLLSGVGFFMDGNSHTGDQIRTALPPVLIVMSFDVLLNVGMGLLVHFLNATPPAQPVLSRAPGNLIPKRELNSRSDGNLIPTQGQFQQMIDRAVKKSVTGYLTAVKVNEEQEAPVQQRPLQLSAPDEAKEPGFFREWATGIKEDVNSLMKWVKDSIKSGKQEAPAPGDQSEITGESGLPPESETSEEDAWEGEE